VFAWSYRALPDESAHFFRLLGLHPGSDFSTAAAAALTATDIGQARHLLDVLVGAHLLEHNPPDRYQFHDLLRIYAIDQARQEEPIEDRNAALRRIVTWYLRRADELQAVTSPPSPRIPLDPADGDATPLRSAGPAEANQWYAAERANLVAATRAAAESGLDEIAWQLAATLHHIYRNLSPFEDWFTTTETGLAAARRLGDRGAEAELLESLATVCMQTRRFTDSAGHYGASLAIRRELGDRQREATVLNGLGLLHLRRRALTEARDAFEQSLGIVEELDDAYWQAVARGNLGTTYYELGDLPTALELVAQTLEVYESLSDQLGQGDSLHSLSRIYRELGRQDDALRLITRAITIAQERGNTVWEGYWLIELGDVRRAIGQPAEALTPYQRAALLQRHIGDRGREAAALDGTGLAYRDLDRYKEAADFHRLAVATFRELDDRWRLAAALNNLGTALNLAGDGDATPHWRAALSNLAEFGDPRAVRLRQRISEALASGQ
jgi:tetratricopeptide (TPR) repeat protein